MYGIASAITTSCISCNADAGFIEYYFKLWAGDNNWSTYFTWISGIPIQTHALPIAQILSFSASQGHAIAEDIPDETMPALAVSINKCLIILAFRDTKITTHGVTIIALAVP